MSDRDKIKKLAIIFGPNIGETQGIKDKKERQGKENSHSSSIEQLLLQYKRKFVIRKHDRTCNI